MQLTLLPGLVEKYFQEVSFQVLVPLSWGSGMGTKHTGQGQNHIHTSLLCRRALVNLCLSRTFLAATESHSGSGAAYPTQEQWEPDPLCVALRMGGQTTAGDHIQLLFPYL